MAAYNLVLIHISLPKKMTNTHKTIEPTAIPQDAFSLRRIQMLILWPLFVCFGLAPLLFSNSEYYDYSKALFWLLAFIIAVFHIRASAIIRSINFEFSSKQLPGFVNKLDNEIAKKYIKIILIDRRIPIAGFTSLFAIWLIYTRYVVVEATTYRVFINTTQFSFEMLLLLGMLIYFFELKQKPYYWWSKKKRINNIVTMMLILLCAVTGSQIHLLIVGKVPIEEFFILNFGNLFFNFLMVLVLIVITSFHNSSRLPKTFYYIKLSALIAKSKNKKRIYIYTYRASILFFLLAGLSTLFDVLLAIGFGILFVTLWFMWKYSVANNESKLVENCQSVLQIECEKIFKKNKLFQNRKFVLMYISIARYVDDNFLLLLFSALLHGVMLSTLIFLNSNFIQILP